MKTACFHKLCRWLGTMRTNKYNPSNSVVSPTRTSSPYLYIQQKMQSFQQLAALIALILFASKGAAALPSPQQSGSSSYANNANISASTGPSFVSSSSGGSAISYGSTNTGSSNYVYNHGSSSYSNSESNSTLVVRTKALHRNLGKMKGFGAGFRSM